VRLCALGHGIADREPALELAQVDGDQALGRDPVGERGDEAGVALRGWERPGEELRVCVRGGDDGAADEELPPRSPALRRRAYPHTAPVQHAVLPPRPPAPPQMEP
jgi:hypothetical protein